MKRKLKTKFTIQNSFYCVLQILRFNKTFFCESCRTRQINFYGTKVSKQTFFTKRDCCKFVIYSSKQTRQALSFCGLFHKPYILLETSLYLKMKLIIIYKNSLEFLFATVYCEQHFGKIMSSVPEHNVIKLFCHKLRQHWLTWGPLQEAQIIH